MPDEKKPEPHPDDVTETNPLIRIYNRSARTYIHGKHKAVPAAFSEVPKNIADLWTKSFPDEIVEAATAQKELGGANAVIAELKAKLAESEKKLSAAIAVPKNDKAAARIAELEGALAKANAEIEQLTSPVAPVAEAAAKSGSDRI
jgi:hypothetical protein